jgi:hypothetical protein
MQTLTKRSNSAVTPHPCCTCELHSEEWLLETMPFSTKVMRSANAINAVRSPIHIAFSCHSHPLKSTQVPSGEQVANGINRRLSMTLCHSKCHSEPLCEPERRSYADDLTPRFGRGFHTKRAIESRKPKTDN